MMFLLWQIAKVVVCSLFMLFCAFVCLVYGGLVYYPFLKEAFCRKEWLGAWDFIKYGK